MKYLIYILLYILCFSCAKQEEGMESSEDMAVEESMPASDSEINIEYEEAEPMNSDIESNDFASSPFESNVFIKQQLQETLNLIVLKNKVDLTADLKIQLVETIQEKVKNYTVHESYDILQITDLNIHDIKQNNNQYQVELNYTAQNQSQNSLKGSATAQITVNTVNIDGQDYHDYQVYFEAITLE
ncbi:hypothetical protein GO491_01465 [Flavobacteriaceae bacterium Ap0902]|nr:hypothetical protein [Flavobacteriaceae bacterium Ap0902]